MSFRTGQRLRALREELGLTIRDVEAASLRIAAKHGNENFVLTLSRLSDIESKGILPSLYRLYTLAVIYRRDIRELFDWYGIDLNASATDLSAVEPAKTHLSTVCDPPSVQVPLRLDPGFDLRRTVNFGRMVEQWGLVPLAYLAKFANTDYTYGYIGSEDYTMYPILMPGSFVQIDESVNKVTEGMWRSEYERPIYFVETRGGYTCCWCSLRGDQLTLQPHPLSPVPVRMLPYPQEADVIGQVIGVAMRLGSVTAAEPRTTPPGPKRLN
ncbi:MAG TPA: helix-turn-helix transcriptional regulator [Terriglobales bacterium]|nr:helix-turn-helix transcriptional regulator [Terriglobales bacterium]